MTDDLRTRLIAVIDAQQVSTYDGGIHPEDVVRLADSVIRELGLHIVDRCNKPQGDPGRFCILRSGHDGRCV